MAVEPLPRITDPDAFRACCEALEEAESRSDMASYRVLRAMVDAAAFCCCPSCDDSEEKRGGCQTCGGDGFVPDNTLDRNAQ